VEALLRNEEEGRKCQKLLGRNERDPALLPENVHFSDVLFSERERI
jgi:hypothetical protein